MRFRARQVGSFFLCPWAWCLFGLTLGATGWVGRGTTVGLFIAGAASVTVFLAIGFQATARRRTALLRQEILRFAAESTDVRIMLTSLPGMVWQSDASSKRVFVNSLWLATTGQTLDEALGDGWLEAVHPKDRYRCEVALRLASGEQEPFEVQYRLRGADGEYHFMCDRAAPCFGDDGAFVGYAGLSVEMTPGEVEERTLEEWIARALRTNETINAQAVALADRCDELEDAKHRAEHSDRAKSDFLSALAAELRDPVEGVENAVKLLRNASYGEHERTQLDRLRSASEQLAAITHRSLSFAASSDDPDPIAIGKFDLRRLIDQSVKRQTRVAAELDAGVSCVVENDVPAVVRADPIRVRSLLMDVWTAALRHAEGGRLTLRVNREGKADESISIHFALTLVGKGITPELAERAFYPADPVQGEEPGLGLAGPRRLAERMGGRLGIEQGRPGNTTVWFSLPVEAINPNFDGRRAHSRLPQESLRCSLGTVLDLSLGGLRVQTKKSPEGTIEIELADEEEQLALRADVCWTRRVGFGRHEAGLRFRGLTPEVTAQLARLATRNRLRRALAAA